MNTPPEKRDPADIEREASEIRADMDRTLDALERKFSPGQLLDRSLGYLRTHGGDLTRTIGDTVKQNPVPILITAAGLTWLIASAVSSRSRSELYYDLDADDEDEDEMDDYEVVADEEPALESSRQGAGSRGRHHESACAPRARQPRTRCRRRWT